MKMPSIKSKWSRYILNKYVLVGIFFIIWMLFFDQNSYLLHRELNEEKNKLEEEELYYKTQLDNEAGKLEKLEKDHDAYEKLAREKYWMKRDNEDIFLIEIKDSTQENE